MQDITSKTIREIALEMPLSTRVFEEYKIDYCCGGRVPFNEACRNAGVDPLTMLLKIESAMQSGDGDPADAVSRKSMSDLVDHIIGSHHVFTRNELDRLSPLMDKVCRKHGDLHPELFEIQELFKQLVHGLPPHMSKEEMVLFPYIKQLDVATRSGEPLDIPHFGTVQNPIRMMMFEHDTDGETLRRMRGLSSDYRPPEGACPSFNALYAGLEDLEKDLHRHIHLENNVLFPQAIDLEKKVESKLPSTDAGSRSCCVGGEPVLF